VSADTPAYCAAEWPWARAHLLDLIARGTIRDEKAARKWPGHICGRPPGHTGRHSCLARECGSWNN
jgi:hypothetical protein